MRFGVHLPLMGLGGEPEHVGALSEYARTAVGLGFDAVAANDHLVFAVPWLDGPTALAAVAHCTGDARLVTTVVNPVVRGAVPTAKALAALDVLSGGRVTAGLGPGSSAADYACVGVPFEQRWPRFEEAVVAVRALLAGEPHAGAGHEVVVPLLPRPAQPGGIPLWVGSWGSAAGLRRVARLGDGWLASAYNIDPAGFARAWQRLQEYVVLSGRDPGTVQNALSTMWFHIDDRDADGVLRTRLVPAMHRPVETMRQRLAFGSAAEVVVKLRALQDAGVQRVFVWPVADHLDQLTRFAREVMPRLQD